MLASTGRTITMMSLSSIAVERLWPTLPVAHTAEGWLRWREQVTTLGAENLAVCVETSQGLVVEQLLESAVSLYPIAPVSSKAYRERKAPSGTKTDAARCLESG